MIPLTQNARIVLTARYLRSSKKGVVVETPEALFRRVAKNIALADAFHADSAVVEKLRRKYSLPLCDLIRIPEFKQLVVKNKLLREKVRRSEREFFTMMSRLDFLPNSPTLFNAGRELQQLAACFVLPIEDDLSSIFQALHSTALIHWSGGGTGFSFSRLRPRGDIVHSTQGMASGPVSFMKIFDCATEQVKQGGKRRGANMGILRVDHPDIEEFITVKERAGVLDNFNLSVGVTDAFMKAVKENSSYALINPRTGRKVGEKKARAIFRLLCREAWKRADPGVVFLDTINRSQPTPQQGRIESTNPCGEVPLLPYEACNLGSINLAHFVRDDSKNGGKNGIDFERLRGVVWKAVHFLDNVIDMSRYPLPEIETMVRGNRKIGLGVMGFADLLVQLQIPYDSENALHIAEKVMSFINREAQKTSVSLARERGVFPYFKGSRYDMGRPEDRVRNATRTSIAPTGTISLIAGCSSGIEPFFALAFTHTIAETKFLQEFNPWLLRELKRRGLYSPALVRKITQTGTLDGVPGIPIVVRGLFLAAHQIPAEVHVRMQAAFQKHTDNAVSKTVNLPRNAPPEEVNRIYLRAYELGCKGISVYRYQSKKQQVLHVGGPSLPRCPHCS